MAGCLLDFGGEQVLANIVIGPEGSESLVGTHVLKDFRLVIDLNTHTISRSRTLRAKKGGKGDSDERQAEMPASLPLK